MRRFRALNSLSIHETFTNIAPGAYPGRTKNSENRDFWTYRLTYWVIMLFSFEMWNFLSVHDDICKEIWGPTQQMLNQ